MRFVRQTLSWTTLSVFLLLLFSNSPVMAAQDAGTCPADFILNSNMCRSGDVSVAAAGLGNLDEGLTCFPGEVIEVAIAGTINLTGQNTRYDIGIWVANDGKPMNVTSANGGAAECEVLPLPSLPVVADNSNIFIVDSFDGLATPQDCYDVEGNRNTGNQASQLLLTSNRDRIVNGMVDVNNDGVIDGTDNSDTLVIVGVDVYAGLLDMDGNGTGGETTDDGIWNGYAVVDGIVDVDGDGTYGAVDGSDDSMQAFNDSVSMTCVAGPNGSLALESLVSWSVDAGNACNPRVPASYNADHPKCSVNSSEVAVEIVGRVTVIKSAPDANGEDFAFGYTNTHPTTADTDNPDVIPDISVSSPFNLMDTEEAEIYAVIGNRESENGPFIPATVVITETNLPIGWKLEDISCVLADEGTPVNTTIDLDTATVSVELSYNGADPLASQDDVICTFDNLLDSATINLVKNTVGGNGEFPFNWVGPNTSGGVVLNTGSVNTDSDTIITTETGTFLLTELIPPNWVLGNAACVDDNGGGSVGTWDNVNTIEDIDLSPGDSVTCTFTNQAVGTVMLAKNSFGGDGSFDYVTDVPGLGTNIQTSGGSGSATPASNVPTGTYSIVETVPAGWNLDSATCSNGSSPDALVLTLGETVTCTFVNTKLGTVIVEKQTLPDGSPQGFEFTGNVSGTTGDGGQIALSNLLPATYTSTETLVDGWTLTSIVCDDGESDTPSGGDVNTGTATFNLDAGETVTCMFTNTQDGSIEVIKSLPITGPDSETFNFTSNFNGNFFLIGDAATTAPVPVAPGSGYTVSEDDPSLAGWVNTGASCGDGSDPLTNIEVSPGETVVCTFTNTPLGSAVVIKDTVGGNGIFGFTGDAPIGPFSLDTTDQFTATTGDLFEYILTAGVYDVTEDNIPAGFELTGILCNDDSDTDLDTATASMDVQLAETVSCTFTNTADGTLIIRKETLPDGAAQGFDFTGDAVGTLHDFSTTAEEIVVSGQPGIYTSAEAVPAGWVISDISCTGNVQSRVTIGANDVSVDLAAGETVICTFENSVEGSITIEKFTQGGLGAFQFNSDLGQFPLDTLNNGNPDAVTFSALDSGTYMFSEVVPSNWTLTDIQCSGATTSIITIGGAGDFDPGDQGVTIELNGGDVIICTFVNDADGSITVTKLTDPTGSAQSFDFTGDITASLTDGQSSSTIMVPAGNYAVSETAVPGWDLTGISCDDDDSASTGNTANFVVASGEVVECTFTNTQRGTITLIKNLPNDNGGDAVETDFTAFIDTTEVPWGVPQELVPGTYTASETTLPGYAPSAWFNACAGDGTVVLGPGENLICEITNDDVAPTLALDKVVQNNNGGTAVKTDWVLSADGPTPLSGDGGVPATAVDAGTYLLSESTGPDGYTPSAWICTDGTLTGDSLVLPVGATAVCTITNSDQASVINLAKTAAPAVDVGGGTWEVVYTITATNSGQGPGDYDIMDMMSPGAGITPVIDASYPALVYAGGETQTGALTAPPLANGGTWVTGEELAAQASESWTVIARFTVDPAQTDPATNACDPAAPVINTGFYNLVEGGDTNSDLTDNETCTGLQLAVLTVMKQVNGGSALPSDFLLTLTGADGIHDSGMDYLSGDQPAVQVGVEYTLSEMADQVAGYMDDDVSCLDNAGNTPVPHPVTLGAGQSVTCTQANTFISSPVEVLDVPVNDKLALLLLTLMLLASGWYFRPANMRRF